jgi:UDP-3-O-[3-hydroxymyristoyl] N-acetylglucosamine deacetylase
VSGIKSNRQHTIGGAFSISGVGIHSGKDSNITVAPAAPDTGVVFIKKGIEIPARVESVNDTTRCTSLGKDGEKVATVEHLLSACLGLGIDNLRVEVDGDELPILDGSSLELTRKLRKSGIIEQNAEKHILEIKRTISVKLGDGFMIGMPSGRFSITVIVDYNHPVVGVQAFHFSPEHDNFEHDLAPARTFGFKEEIQELLEKNLAKGGSLNNALVVEKDGYMNTPRFDDEVVRHKCLDVLGDLALAGMEIKGHIVAYKPSHKLNVEFVEKLQE